jgi:predicted site-specific integrase-resolvase
MSATINSSFAPTFSATPAASGHNSALLSVGQAASQFGAIPSLRRWADAGKLTAYSTPSGHRRFSQSDLRALLGIREDRQDEVMGNPDSVPAHKVVLLARVSSNKQGAGFDTGNGENKEGGKESDLFRQVERLREAARKEYGVDNPVVYSDIASGMNLLRKNFLKLIDEALEGKLRGTIVLATYPDRLARFAGSFVEHILEKCGAKVVYLSQEEVSDEADLSADVLAVITHFTAKVNGNKAKKTCTLNLSPEGLERARELKEQGYSVAQSVKILNSEGYLCQSEGKRKPKPITEWVLARVYASEGVKLLDKAAPVELPEEETATSFQRFSDEYLTYEVGNFELKLKASELYRRYMVWCEQRGETPMTVYAVGLAVKGKVHKTTSQGTSIYRGVAFKA